MKIVVINGPNLNFLGIREPHIYGNSSLNDLEKKIKNYSCERQIDVQFFQSNSEGALIDYLQSCYYEKVEGIIINPGAYTHYSYALSDAIKSISIPTIEVHISHIHNREEFRKHSVTASSCIGVIEGFGMESYRIALDAMLYYLEKQKSEETENEN
ncbi:type II 3-dehydroquinate dehydratase [Sporanaerobium hydrogeniformans]|uniref:Type II 3-dehydroquinate dehydratase n=1 Tax=Sporanaerobium hydrogeniformans TaxID=3072179 RepID=A0AC61DHT9_9FIRM|nr:type II 3-dehydroquinate dehydratase [Sporanaerobium hydrogeniformans]PHV72350.1 type II 3-dehydroquinate dehydratase [Sporanaerobium hydrogeniformans]